MDHGRDGPSRGARCTAEWHHCPAGRAFQYGAWLLARFPRDHFGLSTNRNRTKNPDHSLVQADDMVKKANIEIAVTTVDRDPIEVV